MKYGTHAWLTFTWPRIQATVGAGSPGRPCRPWPSKHWRGVDSSMACAGLERRRSAARPRSRVQLLRLHALRSAPKTCAHRLAGTRRRGPVRARVSEVLGKRRRLSLAMTRKLHETLSTPLESLVGEYPLRRKRGPKPRPSGAGSSKLANAAPRLRVRVVARASDEPHDKDARPESLSSELRPSLRGSVPGYTASSSTGARQRLRRSGWSRPNSRRASERSPR